MFLKRLSKNDYFCGEIEHSKKWTDLENKAKAFFIDSYESDTNESHRKTSSKGKFITRIHILIFIAFSVIKQLYETINENMSIKTSKIKDDSLEWIQLDESEFVSNLQKKYSWTDSQKPDQSEENITKMADEIENLTDRFKKFTQKISDFDGVEDEDNIDQIQIDPAKFAAGIKKFVIPEQNSDCDSDDDRDDDYLDSDDLQSETEEYYDQMNVELGDTKVLQGMIKDEKDEKLSVDLNLVSGLLKSYESQMGLSGPVGNILNSMGLELPENTDNKTAASS